MPMVTPTLNLPQPPVATKSAAPASAPTPTTPPPPKAADVPSTTVTLSPQALSAMAAASHPASSPSPTSPTSPATPLPPAHDSSVYEALKSGIAAAVTDAGDAIADAAHAVVDGVETTLSNANKVAKGVLELPFAAVAKACDAAGAVIDEL